uniref:Neutral ceramidase n=1 Tax=Sinocyclocheilus rhinocerous TaxID=307959 RepID=A0A673FVV1_9TELE
PSPSVNPPENPYLIGVGRADCTGPVADLPMTGYANTEQTVRGIHTRLFSRAFIVDDGSKRVVFITADIGMVSQRLRLEVAHTLFWVSSSVVMGKVYIKHFSYNSTWGFIGYVSALSWFAVSDNLGYASYAFEQEKNIGFLPGEGPFVAGFSSSNLGDSSPNIRGPVCVNTGEKCDYLNSSCPIGGKKACIAFGPGEDVFESTRIIGKNMSKKAKGRTCKPALGHSFAAGTTDGGGEFNFIQGDTDGDPFWDGIRDAVLGPPSNETTACHQPKPILFSTGEMDSPLPWHPATVDVQIITIGSLAIVAVPGEFTTMSGRRIREAVKESFANAVVVVAGLCNIYTHYITTYEEYQIQRYEGASTIYGPHTLSAYIQRYRGLARAIAHETIGELPKGPEPPFFDEDKFFNQVKDPVADVASADTTFGDVLQQVNPVYKVVGLAGRCQSKVEWHIPLTAQTGTYWIQHFGHYNQFTDNNTITPYVGTSDAFKVTRSFYYY